MNKRIDNILIFFSDLFERILSRLIDLVSPFSQEQEQEEEKPDLYQSNTREEDETQVRAW